MYEIYVIGSMQLMQSVLNAVASMTATGGTAGNGNMISLGLILSVLFVVVKGIVSQKLELQYFFISLVLYLAMFAPKVTVHLEDVSTGAVINIANVPVGVAAIGSIASSVGTSLSKGYETLFSVPGITDGGYITPLKILAAVRNPNLGNANTLGAVPSGGTTIDVTKSLNNYMIDCAYQDINAELPGQEVTEANVKAATDATLWASYKVNAPSWFTITYLTNGSPEGTLQSCSDAWSALNTALPIHAALSVDYMGKNNGDSAFTVTADNAITTLTGTSVTMQNFMLTSFIRNVAENAKAGYFTRSGDVAMSAMLTQAKTQRQIQWAAEKDMFEDVAKPLIAAIEAFFYAISPIMIFLVLLGSFGWGLFLKYIIMAIWIQLWMPILAVNNHYILISVQEAFTNLSLTGLNFTTADGMNETWDTLATWTATGGMLAAATPLMALMVITGSFYTFTKLTDRMNGGDHVNEKQMAPDLTKPAPVVGMGSMQDNAAHANFSYGSGTTHSGFQIPNISYGSDSSRQVQSARQELSAASSSYDSALSNAMSNSHSLLQGSSSRAGSSHDYKASNSTSDQMMYNLAQQVLKGSDATHRETNSLAAQMSLGLSSVGGNDSTGEKATAALKKAAKGFPIGGNASEGFNIQDSMAKALSSRDSSGRTRAETLSKEYRDAVGQDFAMGKTSTYSQGLSDEDRSNIAATRREMFTETQQFNEAVSSSNNRRSNVNVGVDTLSRQADTNPAFAEGLGRLIADNGLSEKVNENMTAVQGIGNSNTDTQRIRAAEILTLDRADNATVAKLDALIGEHVVGNGAIANYGNSTTNDGITSGQVPNSGSVQGEVQGKMPSPEGFTSRDGMKTAQQANTAQLQNSHNAAVELEKGSETSSGVKGKVSETVEDSQLALLREDIDQLGFVASTLSQTPNPVDMFRASWDQQDLAADFEKEALAAGFNEQAAELYGLTSLNAIRNGGASSVHEADINEARIEELSKDLNPTVVEAMRHYSLFNDDQRDLKLRSMTGINGVGN